MQVAELALLINCSTGKRWKETSVVTKSLSVRTFESRPPWWFGLWSLHQIGLSDAPRSSLRIHSDSYRSDLILGRHPPRVYDTMGGWVRREFLILKNYCFLNLEICSILKSMLVALLPLHKHRYPRITSLHAMSGSKSILTAIALTCKRRSQTK